MFNREITVWEKLTYLTVTCYVTDASFSPHDLLKDNIQQLDELQKT